MDLKIFFQGLRKKLRFLTDDKQYTLFSNRDILRLVIPLFFEQLLVMLVGSVDTLMVAGLGEASISAVSLVNMLNNCIGSIIFALATGGGVVVAQYLGAGSLIRAREGAKQLLAVVLITGSLILCLGEVFLTDIIRIVYGKLDADVHAGVVSYFGITLISFPFIALYGGCAALFRVMNRTKTTMYISFVSNIVNVAGNALLIYLFRLGVAGAAYATVLARLVAVGIIVFMITDRSNTVFADFSKGFRISWQFVKKILFIGIPLLLFHVEQR
jgi:Na+-driven multidrug efflux pump